MLPYRLFVILCSSALLLSCSTAPQSTRLTLDDFNEVTERMAQSLGQSDLLASRAPDSPRMVIVIDKVLNLTTDLIPPSEQWMLMARLRGSLSIQELSTRKNIVFQVEPQRWALVRQAGFEGELGASHPPTHVMSAVFRSARREMRDSHDYADIVAVTDFYHMQYNIVDLQTRQIQWTDDFHFKRQAKGSRLD